MNQVVEQYDDSEVAWVYRHFPLEQLHPVKARKTALATECAADQGGDDAFWAFADRFYEITPSNNQTDTDAILPQIAREIGLDLNEFNDCVATEKFADAVDADIQNAVETGGRGTPWSIMIGPDGTKTPIGGALPYESLKPMIDQALSA
jgi:protein-disulfide isomerase